MTLQELNLSCEETVEHVRYLISLENNISYDNDKLELKLRALRSQKKNPPPEKDKKMRILTKNILII